MVVWLRANPHPHPHPNPHPHPHPNPHPNPNPNPNPNQVQRLKTEEADRISRAGDTSSEADQISRAEADVGRPEPKTLIDEIYAGELRSSVVCLSCGQVSTSTEPFLSNPNPNPSPSPSPYPNP